MQGEIVVDPVLKCKMDLVWGKARKEMMENVRELIKLGAHKQDVNRLLEPLRLLRLSLLVHSLRISLISGYHQKHSLRSGYWLRR